MSQFILDIRLNNFKKEGAKNPSLPVINLDYRTQAKFQDDKINFQDENYYLILDGIVLNKSRLFSGINGSSWSDYLIKCYEDEGNQFFKRLKGSYYGFLYSKKEKKVIVFSDHISSKPVYYALYGNNICFSNNFSRLVRYLKEKKKSLSLNESAGWLLITYGYVFEDITIVKEIKRLMVGYCAVIHEGQLTLENFYRLTNGRAEISEREAIDGIDKYFRSAVQLAFEKDKEYGYKHMTTLSGGIDSRMTVWIAHELGYTRQLNLTFSQTNYLDEKISKQIAADLKHEWLFKALDNGNFLMDIDEVTEITGGNVIFYGSAHAMSLFKNLNFDDFGILHSGMLGEIMKAEWCPGPDAKKKFEIGNGTFSSKLMHEIKELKLNDEYPNEEIFKIYICGFYGGLQGLFGPMTFSETYSPLYDIDLIGFVLSIPIEFRLNHRVYRKWIITRYPEAAKYVWEAEKAPVNYPYRVNIRGKSIPLTQLPVRVLAKLGFQKYGYASKNHMHPFEYWYQSNGLLKKFMDNYYNETIHLLGDYPGLQSGCKYLYSNTAGTEKIQVLSLLSALKTHF
jgi:asparagine synthase (glutamine-hydrolysing)